MVGVGFVICKIFIFMFLCVIFIRVIIVLQNNVTTQKTERNFCSQTEKQKCVLFESKTYSVTRVVLKCFLVNQKQDDEFDSIKLFVCESGYTND